MPIPNNQIRVAEIKMQGIRSTQGSTSKNYEFVFHYRRTTVSNIPDEVILEASFQSNIATALVALLNESYTQTANTVRFVDDALRATEIVSRSLAGGVSGDSMPAHASNFILYRTALRGKSYRGSKHFGPLSESDTTAASADVLNAAAITAWNAMITGLSSPMPDSNGNVWVPCVMSKAAPAQYRVNPTNVITNDATLLLLNHRIGTMNRRKVKSIY